MAKPTNDELLTLAIEACEQDDYIGICRNCGAERYNTDPDARHYLCENCGKRQVFGAQELVIMLAL